MSSTTTRIESFAKAIPDGHVTAIDLNPDTLPRAQAIAEIAGVKNIEFQQVDAYKLPSVDEKFDIAFCYQVLTHLKAPWDALHEMLRVTKPGGIVAAREGDLEMECIWHELLGLLKFHKFATGRMNAAGGTPNAGRQLLSWVLKEGVERGQITVSYSTWPYSTLGDKKIWVRSPVTLGFPCGKEQGFNNDYVFSPGHGGTSSRWSVARSKAQIWIDYGEWPRGNVQSLGGAGGERRCKFGYDAWRDPHPEIAVRFDASITLSYVTLPEQGT